MFCDRFTIEGEVFVYDEVLPGVCGNVLGADFELNRGGAVCFFWGEVGGDGFDFGCLAVRAGADLAGQQVGLTGGEAFVFDGVDDGATGKRQNLLVRAIDGNCCADPRVNWNDGIFFGDGEGLCFIFRISMFCDRFTIEGEVFVYDEVLPGVFGDVLGANFELNRGGAVCFFWDEGGVGGDSGFFASGVGADFTFQQVVLTGGEVFVSFGVDRNATAKGQDL